MEAIFVGTLDGIFKVLAGKRRMANCFERACRYGSERCR